jgi:hypothetical protein
VRRDEGRGVLIAGDLETGLAEFVDDVANAWPSPSQPELAM